LEEGEEERRGLALSLYSFASSTTKMKEEEFG
jgi:hypothetical protein